MAFTCVLGLHTHVRTLAHTHFTDGAISPAPLCACFKQTLSKLSDLKVELEDSTFQIDDGETSDPGAGRVLCFYSEALSASAAFLQLQGFPLPLSCGYALLREAKEPLALHAVLKPLHCRRPVS